MVWWTLAAVALQVPFMAAGVSLRVLGPRRSALWREARSRGAMRAAAVVLALARAGLLAVPAGVAIGVAAAGAHAIRYGVAAGIVAFEALFQTGAAIAARRA